MKLIHSISIRIFVFALTLAFVLPLQAQQWWFDVEVIVFKQLTSAEDLDENFGSWAPIDTDSSIDLLTPYLFPNVEPVRNNLPLCYPPKEPLPSPESLEQALAEYKESLASLDAEFNEEQSLFASDGVNESNESLYDEGLNAADTNAVDDLFTQLEQEQQDESDSLLGFSNGPAISQEAIDSAFDDLFVAVDQDIHWVDVNPLNSVACQFDAEKRYFSALFNPYVLEPKTVNQTPRVIDPPFKHHNGTPHLLPQENLQLKTIARDLNRQRGVRIVSHMAWRQEVQFGRTKAQSYRLLAGQNYGNAYQANGEMHPVNALEISDTLAVSDSDKELPLNVEESLINQVSAIIHNDSPTKPIEQILFESEMLAKEKQFSSEQSQSVQDQETSRFPPVWEVDGLFKVYLQQLGQVPYLHIDSQLNYRQPGKLPIDNDLALFNNTNSSVNNDPEAFLHSYQFKQLRRIISRQIHYFDHPAFGLIVQLRRYRPPVND